jgi:hypothetical protein
MPQNCGMAIRFYCPFCDRLLGIADRKAGAVVVCPHCGGRVGVPTPGMPPPVPPPPAGPVLTLAQVTMMALACLILIAIAFALGLLVGAWR